MPPDTHPFSRDTRFDVTRTLGRGAQGTVYLATDTRLHRPVALKTVKGSGEAGGRLAEARMVSGLQHPNIVTLFDAQEGDELAYLVFEYVDGPTLHSLIKEKRTLAPPDAVKIMIGVLRGVSFAHARQILHCDIKPSNILITPDGTPRVMDFGIAQRVSSATSSRGNVAGTPCYIAPEMTGGAPASESTDLFAAGIVFYEMLTGAPPIVGSTAFETMHRMSEEDFEPPIKRNPAVDARLNQIVMKAIAKSPADRYPNADAMIAALDDYLSPAQHARNGANGQPTLEFILQRMRFKSDFPALSESISAINRVVSSDKEPVSTLTNVILKDIALTNKLLKVVNAAHYKQFGGSISTISRAVSILGFDSVRAAALSLLLFEHLQNKDQAADLQDLVAGCLFSSAVARELAQGLGVANSEEAAICAMFQPLGKLLVTFYLHEESVQIAQLARAKDISEDRAAASVLGMSYTQIALGIAKHWNFPASMTESLTPCDGTRLTHALFKNESLRVVASCANELSHIAMKAEPRDKRNCVTRLLDKYGSAMELSKEKLVTVLEKSTERFKSEVTGTGFKNGAVRVAREIGHLAQAARGESPSECVDPVNGPPTLPGVIPVGELPNAQDRRAQLMAGIQDITNTLAGDYDLSQALRIILETIYRGCAFEHVLLFTRDSRGQALHCRLGFGQNADKLVRDGLSISLTPARDLFYGAISRGADVFIQDAFAEKVAAHVPAWHRSKLGTRTFLLLPMVVRSKPVGLIYADSNNASLDFDEADMRLLRTLRSQAVLAIRQQEG